MKEPSVIDEDLLNAAVSEQLNPDIAEIARKEGIQHRQVETLRLDYKNILKIDNLYEFVSLRKLQIDNNIIEKIENISFLKNLKWLDLSFNNISKIEGLDELVNLTDLSLHNNQITVVEGLDNLKKLEVFSIGNNKIDSLDAVSYLTRFKSLRILNLAGNPVSQMENYKLFTLSRLRKLKFLDYRLVDSETLRQAKEKYMDELIAIEEEDKSVEAQQEIIAEKEKQEQIYRKAHVDGVDDLIKNLFDKDPDFQKLHPLFQDQFQEFFTENMSRSLERIKDLKQVALQKMGDKELEVLLFEKAMKEGRQSQKLECIKLIDAFSHSKKQQVRKLQGMRESDLEVLVGRLKKETEALSDQLMALEMDLVEQSEEIIKDFQHAYSEHTSQLLEVSQQVFSQLREFENEFFEKFNELVAAGVEKAAKSHLDELSDQVRDLVTDKELLITTVNATHEFRLARLDAFEDNLVTGSQKEAEKVINKVQQEEITRNRSRVSEIVRFTRKTLEEISQIEDSF